MRQPAASEDRRPTKWLAPEVMANRSRGSTVRIFTATLWLLAARIPAVSGTDEDLDSRLGGPRAGAGKGKTAEAERALAPEPAADESTSNRDAAAGGAEAIRRRVVEEIIVTAQKKEETLREVPTRGFDMARSSAWMPVSAWGT